MEDRQKQSAPTSPPKSNPPSSTASTDASQNGRVPGAKPGDAPASSNPLPPSPDAVKVASQELATALIAAATDNVAISAGLPPAAAADTVKSLDRQRIADLIEQIKESADKLAADQPSRGDLKILSRTMRELRYAFKVFSPYRNRRKVTVFGSARTRPDKPTYQQAVKFGRAMAEIGWLVVTGAASGIMEAGHLGAGRENSMGLNIMLPFEQSSNPIIAGDPKLVHMKYFFTRKLMFVKECDAVALFPGGFGTLDEGLEVLTLLQTGKRDMVPVVFVDEPGGKFWQPLLEFFQNRLLADGMVSPEDSSLYKWTDSVETAVHEIQQFFRVYHSMRYVKNKLVFRLQTPISAELLADINAEFDDILTDGQFITDGPQKEERDEPALISLPRLVFHFNRRSLGRLRQLIDTINAGRILS
ncbi:MAG TPA: TIGR00730 family Rossman fold protein [Pirellulales bacterium]|nr:TIGR00730 family Rossman fold protein [Pirellulales bacterium]